jgi:hypothetical protein
MTPKNSLFFFFGHRHDDSALDIQSSLAYFSSYHHARNPLVVSRLEPTLITRDVPMN